MLVPVSLGEQAGLAEIRANIARYDKRRLGNRLGWILSVPGRPGRCPDGSRQSLAGPDSPGWLQIASGWTQTAPDGPRQLQTAPGQLHRSGSNLVDPNEFLLTPCSLLKSCLCGASLGSRSVKWTLRELRQECLNSTIHAFRIVFSLLSKENLKIHKNDRFTIARFATEGWSGRVQKSSKETVPE